jgi:hypothetical protein
MSVEEGYVEWYSEGQDSMAGGAIEYLRQLKEVGEIRDAQEHKIHGKAQEVYYII